MVFLSFLFFSPFIFFSRLIFSAATARSGVFQPILQGVFGYINLLGIALRCYACYALLCTIIVRLCQYEAQHREKIEHVYHPNQATGSQGQ